MPVPQVIQFKVDTAAKLAAIAGLPTNQHLFASEINRIANLLRLLLSATDTSNINPFYNNSLGDITGTTLLEFINNNAAIPFLSPSYVSYTIDGVDYVEAFIGMAGNYGDGVLQVTAAMFILLERSDEGQVVQSMQYWIGEYNGIFNMSKCSSNFPAFTYSENGEYLVTNIPLSDGMIVSYSNRLDFQLNDSLSKFILEIKTLNYLGVLAFTTKRKDVNTEQVVYFAPNIIENLSIQIF